MDILARIDSGEITLSEAISFYKREGDPEELIGWTKDHPHSSEALYILSEMGARARSVWKKVIPFIGSSNKTSSYWSMDIVHAYAGDDDHACVLKAILLVNLNNGTLFAKACAILASLSDVAISRMRVHAYETASPQRHLQGLQILTNGIEEEEITRVFARADETLKLYLCALICRRFPKSHLTSLLPPMVREDLELELRTQRT